VRAVVIDSRHDRPQLMIAGTAKTPLGTGADVPEYESCQRTVVTFGDYEVGLPHSFV
jgi:hypothetical protein